MSDNTHDKAIKTLGKSMRRDLEYRIGLLRREKRESLTNFAKRRYYMQMEIYSSYAGQDLDVDFDLLPKKIRDGWIKGAKEADLKHKSGT